MSIKLTKEIKGKKVELDLISLNGKTTVRTASAKIAKGKGVSIEDLKKVGFEVEK